MKLYKLIQVFTLLLAGMLLHAQTPDGELKRWHKITLDFAGPNTSENAGTNPFSNYRLDVTFTHDASGASYVVPGFYAACADAENSSCDTGNVWRVHFAPGETGTWNWTAAFTSGTDVAINGGGSNGGFMNGDTGSFSIAESDKSGRDHRSKDKGRLQYVGEHYLRYSGTNSINPNGKWFVKAGADSPENTFAYEDFDNTPNRGSRRKAWAAHQQDYNAGDASDYTWDSGKGSELLGVVNYLSSEGANAMSFLTFSLGGDDENIFPHLLKVSESVYNGYSDAEQWNQGVHKDRFDVSKMAQWEKIFEYADKKGMYLHFKTMETENDNFMDSNENGRERKLYYRELIARFGHHLALNWNLTEETTLDDDVTIDITEYIKSIDAYGHNIVIHTYPNQKNQRYTPLLGNNSELTGASLQSNVDDVHNDVIEWIEKSKNAGKKWVVANDEQGPANLGIRIDDQDIRQKVLYGTLMAGGAGVEYYYGYTNTDGDLNNQDHRLRGVAYEEVGYALKFFTEYFNDYLIGAESNDGLTGDSDDFVLANEGKAYAVYLPNGGSTSLSLPTGNSNYTVQWFNPGSGDLGSSSILGNTLSAPNSSNDWVALIINTGVEPPVTCDVYEESGGLVIIEAENRTADLGEWSIKTTSLNNAYTGDGYLEFTGNTPINGNPNSPIEYQFKINEPGLYELHLRCARETLTINGEVRTDIANDCYVRVDGDYNEGPNAGNSHNDQAPLAALKSDTKFFGGNDKSFVWADGSRLDLGGETNKRSAIYDFKAGETYTLTVSGRSQLFKLDRIMFRKTSVNESGAESLDNTETFADDCGNGENNAPTVEIDTPVNNSSFTVGTDIAFNANASDSDGTIEQVQFFVDGVLLKTERVIPYTATMSGYEKGTYSVTAIATDDEGATATSSVITIQIIEDSTPPPGNIIDIPGSFEAEDFENKSGTVKIEATPGSSGSNLGFIKNGDYTEYLVDVDTGGEYTVEVYASSAGTGGVIEILEEGAVVGSLDIPVTGQWHSYEAYTTTISLTPGEKTLRFSYEGTTGYLFNIDKVAVTKETIIEEQTVTLSPIQDAYLQGATRYNSDMIRVELNNRTGYLMFDLSSIAGTITNADLKFTVYSDPGNGNVTIHQGDSNNWAETTISTANKPAASDVLATINTTFAIGNTINVPLQTETISGDALTLILNATSGNDFAFASKENTVSAKPELVITYTTNKSTTISKDFKMFPNPVVDVVNFSGVEAGDRIKVYNMMGALQKEILLKEGEKSLNLSDLASGYYLLTILEVGKVNKELKTEKLIKL
ncbi:hypothetical protein GCM10022393_30780 [Aquimarina addita]|uniref:CBM6 domain-containing protein n=1 Tax=Aquimarina addita TaxID=870485 RepID=A0ABP6USL1_9FLAO